MNRFAAAAKSCFIAGLIFANSSYLTAQSDSIYRLSPGTRLTVKLDTELSSKVSTTNDKFIARLARPFTVRGTVVLAAGTTLEGRIVGVTHAAVGGQAGKLDIVFETITVPGGTRRIEALLVSPPRAAPVRTFRTLSVIGGVAAGAAIGAVSGAGRGALVGAGIGAGAGTSVAFLRKGRDVRIRKDEQFEIELRKEVMLPVLDY